MQIVCPKCKKQLQIPLDKLPPDKDKAMVKCPGCQQVITFNIPRKPSQAVQNPPPGATVVDDAMSGSNKLLKISLIHDESGKVYDLKPGRTTLGRKGDIAFEDDLFLSRVHCLIQVSEKGGRTKAILTDDGTGSASGEPSKNGTFYNGERLGIYDQIILNKGDIIRIGRTELKVQID